MSPYCSVFEVLKKYRVLMYDSGIKINFNYSSVQLITWGGYYFLSSVMEMVEYHISYLR